MLGPTAHVIVELLLIAPRGSYVEWDDERNEMVLVIAGGMLGQVRRSRPERDSAAEDQNRDKQRY